jgi:leader peptidase (prepilin peptidase)/N-methyltransferase
MTAALACTLVLVVIATGACAVSDALTGTIPNRITYPSFAAIVLLGVARGTLGDTLAGAAAGGGSLLLLHAATSGRGLGLGDVKLGTCIGAGLGITAGLVAIGTAFVAGGCVGLALLAARRARRGDLLPFGPYLAIGTLLATIGVLMR